MNDDVPPVWWTDQVEQRHLSLLRGMADHPAGKGVKGRCWKFGRGYWYFMYHRHESGTRTFVFQLGRRQLHVRVAFVPVNR